MRRSPVRQVLAAAPVGLPDGEKHSNNDYWLLAEGVNPTSPAYVRQSPLDPSANSNAALNIKFYMGQGIFKTHFPEAEIYVNQSDGAVRIEDDLLVSAESYLGGVALYVPYLAGDPDATPDACGGAATHTLTAALRPSTPSLRLNFTATGGLRAPCSSFVAVVLKSQPKTGRSPRNGTFEYETPLFRV